MDLVKKSGYFKEKNGGKIALILEAAGSPENQKWIANIAEKIIDGCSRRSSLRLFFLGNPKIYPMDSFRSMFRENNKRANIVSSILASIADEVEYHIIICSKPVFDLEDWSQSPIVTRLICITVSGEKVQYDAKSLEEKIGKIEKHYVSDPSFDDQIVAEVCRRVNDPLNRVELYSPSFMPLKWSNSEYKIVEDDGVHLVAENLGKEKDYELSISYLIEDGVKLALRATHHSNQITNPLLELCEYEEHGTSETTKYIDPNELNIFNQAIRRKPYVCALCGGRHPWDKIDCDDSENSVSGVGESLVYASLAGRSHCYAVFHETDGGVQYEIFQGDVLRLSSNSVAVRVKKGRKAALYSFDEKLGTWIKTATPFEQYQKLSTGNSYAILL